MRDTTRGLLILMLICVGATAVATAERTTPEIPFLDPTFGGGGFVSLVGSGYHREARVLLRPDGRLLLIGGRTKTPDRMGVAVQSYTEDGYPDPNFGFEGSVVTDIYDDYRTMQRCSRTASCWSSAPIAINSMTIS